jgi:Toprim-like
VRVGEFLEETVLPALQGRLDTAFPEFGFMPDAHGWVATNEDTTHRVLGVRAERVVAHGPAPPGILIHGGDAIPWTAYLNGGQLPRGHAFVSTVKELAARAGVDTTPIERPQPRDRRTDLLHDFFTLCRVELHGKAGAHARDYLQRRGLPAEAIDRSSVGVVPPAADTKRLLESAGYTEHEISRSGVLADGRWAGRLCGAWRDEHASIRTLWARTIHDADTAPKFLYLRGAGRSGLPPYGLSDVLKLPPRERRELVLVEGLLDVHHLRAHGLANIAAVGAARIQPDTLAGLTRHGIETVTLAFDNDQAGREGLARAIDRATRLENARVPALRVVEPSKLGDSKDPDEYVRMHGIDVFRERLQESECGVTWRTVDRMRHLGPASSQSERRAALEGVGMWLGRLPARLALEVEDAIRVAAERSGYEPIAVERAFRAKFWAAEPERPERERALHPTRELDHSIDL